MTLLTSTSGSAEHRSVPLSGTGKASISSYDRNGRLVATATATTDRTATALIMPGGFTILTR